MSISSDNIKKYITDLFTRAQNTQLSDEEETKTKIDIYTRMLQPVEEKKIDEEIQILLNNWDLNIPIKSSYKYIDTANFFNILNFEINGVITDMQNNKIPLDNVFYELRANINTPYIYYNNMYKINVNEIIPKQWSDPTYINHTRTSIEHKIIKPNNILKIINNKIQLKIPKKTKKYKIEIIHNKKIYTYNIDFTDAPDKNRNIYWSPESYKTRQEFGSLPPVTVYNDFILWNGFDYATKNNIIVRHKNWEYIMINIFNNQTILLCKPRENPRLIYQHKNNIYYTGKFGEKFDNIKINYTSSTIIINVLYKDLIIIPYIWLDIAINEPFIRKHFFMRDNPKINKDTLISMRMNYSTDFAKILPNGFEINITNSLTSEQDALSALVEKKISQMIFKLELCLTIYFTKRNKLLREYAQLDALSYSFDDPEVINSKWWQKKNLDKVKGINDEYLTQDVRGKQITKIEYARGCQSKFQPKLVKNLSDEQKKMHAEQGWTTEKPYFKDENTLLTCNPCAIKSEGNCNSDIKCKWEDNRCVKKDDNNFIYPKNVSIKYIDGSKTYESNENMPCCKKTRGTNDWSIIKKSSGPKIKQSQSKTKIYKGIQCSIPENIKNYITSLQFPSTPYFRVGSEIDFKENGTNLFFLLEKYSFVTTDEQNSYASSYSINENTTILDMIKHKMTVQQAISLIQQENFDIYIRTEQDLQKMLNSFNIKRCIRLLEFMYNCYIIVFYKNIENGKISIEAPTYLNNYLEQYLNYDHCIFIYQHYGSISDKNQNLNINYECITANQPGQSPIQFKITNYKMFKDQLLHYREKPKSSNFIEQLSQRYKLRQSINSYGKVHIIQINDSINIHLINPVACYDFEIVEFTDCQQGSDNAIEWLKNAGISYNIVDDKINILDTNSTPIGYIHTIKYDQITNKIHDYYIYNKLSNYIKELLIKNYYEWLQTQTKENSIENATIFIQTNVQFVDTNIDMSSITPKIDSLQSLLQNGKILISNNQNVFKEALIHFLYKHPPYKPIAYIPNYFKYKIDYVLNIEDEILCIGKDMFEYWNSFIKRQF